MEIDNTDEGIIEYSKVLDKYAVGTLKVTVDQTKINQKEKSKSTLILCLDKSGSMNGQPMEATKKGAKQVGEKFKYTNTFDELVTIPFDSTCKRLEYKNPKDYESQISTLRAGGGTCFSSVFNEIERMYDEYGYDKYKDCTIMFMTDGCTNSNSALSSLDSLKKHLDIKAISYRFFCIGFSQYHDANLLGAIARSGSEMGNFVYIEERSVKLENDIADALNQSFQLAPGSCSLKGKVYQKDGYSAEIRLNLEEENKEFYTSKIVLPLDTLQNENDIYLETDIGTITLIAKEVEEKKESELNQILYFYDIKLYDFIVQAQTETTKEKISQMYEEVKVLDEKLNDIYSEGIKIKTKIERKEVLEPIQSIKQKISALVHFLRDKQLGHNMSNDFIARLNQMAYEGVRGSALKRKLDSRAMVNESKFQELNDQIAEYVKDLDMKKLREENKEASEEIGDCFLTTKDVFECIEDQDCMCVCLDIKRSEAAIADPTKLVIKKIVPNFLSADSFIEAAQFALKNNEEAHGGFDKNKEANILVGVGRENITGVMPLYLFSEHFHIANKKVPQILGLMCTCDPMGYTPAQFFTVPFLVLHRAFTDYESNKDSKIREIILKQLYLTCREILTKLDKDGAKDVKILIENMLKCPLYSTQEHLTNIPLLLSKLYVLKKNQKLEFSSDELEKTFKVVIEELDRRSQDQNLSQMSEKQVCKKYLCPNIENEIADLLEQKLNSDTSEEEKGSTTLEGSSKKRETKESAKTTDMEIDEPKTSKKSKL